MQIENISEFFRNLIELEIFCENLKKKDLSLQDSITETQKFFLIYNKCFPFFLLHKTKNLFSLTELDFKPYFSNSEKFSTKTEEEVCDFNYTPLDNKYEEFFQEIWDKFSVPGNCFLASRNTSMILDLRRKNSFLSQILEHPNVRIFEDIGLNLPIFLATYNFWLEEFYESLSVRETLVQVYRDSRNFPVFQEEILENILGLDQLNNDLAIQFLTFKKSYSSLCKIRKEQNEK